MNRSTEPDTSYQILKKGDSVWKFCVACKEHLLKHAALMWTARSPSSTLFWQAESVALQQPVAICAAFTFWTCTVKCCEFLNRSGDCSDTLASSPGIALLNGPEVPGTRSYLRVDKCNDIKEEQQTVAHQTKHIERMMKQSWGETASEDQAWDKYRTWVMSVWARTELKIQDPAVFRTWQGRNCTGKGNSLNLCRLYSCIHSTGMGLGFGGFLTWALSRTKGNQNTESFFPLL